MKKIAFLFSGQGSQYAGMGRELYDNFAAAREVYECGSDILGINLAELSFNASESDLAPTKVSQPAIFAVSMAAYSVVKEFCEPTAFAGHSLGEYAALTASKAFTLEDGFRLIGIRASAMQSAAELAPGGMFAIVGSDEDTVTKICNETAGYVLPVNFNAPSQTVIAGEVEAVQKAADALAVLGAKTVKLAVSSGFHSKLMEPAAIELREKISDITVNHERGLFYNNISGNLLSTDTDLKDYLCRHLVCGVYFHKEISAMVSDGINTFIELGPNKVLTMLVKRNFKEVAAMNVENMKTLEKCESALSE